MSGGDFYESGVFLMQNFDSGGKAIRRITGMVIAGLLAMLLLTGCSGERMETRREIDRIYMAADQTAEDRSADYITE